MMSLVRVIQRILVIGLSLAATAGYAAGPPISRYTAEVPVNGQSDTERAEALKTGLGQVVIRLTGDSGVFARSDVARQVAQAERYVQQFEYRQDIVTDSGQPQKRLTLVAQFDRDAVNQLLRTLGLTQPGSAPAGDVGVVHSGSYHLWISGVRSADDYARLIGALNANESVRDLQSEQARGDGVLLRVTLSSGLQSLLDNPALAGTIRLVKANPPIDGVDAMLSLQSSDR